MSRPFPDLATLELGLAGRPHPPVEGPGRPASVMLCLRQGAVLLLRRATHPLDPWSGHVSLPGGRREEDDPGLLETAIRETREEVGLDLRREGRVLGTLGEYAGRGAGVRSIRIAAFVAAFDETPRLTLSGEVDEAHWVPLDLLRPTTATVSEISVPVPAYRPRVANGELVVWGITFGILELLRAVSS
ncbi:MAG TPA: CoA pyrophosphatase [Gaiellales bacterium]|jgi:8-oxo-dGTP pyrophosphatase MutT (NUDIX family)